MVTLNLPQELETRLRDEAAREGLDTDAYIVRALDRVVPRTPTSVLTRRESELFGKINVGLSEAEWLRCRELKSRIDDEKLSPEEQQELNALTDRIERINAERMRYIIELADLRHVPVDQLMNQLGLANGGEADGQDNE